MPVSEAKKRSNKKWNDANMKERYDHVHLVLLKGDKATIQAAADKAGQSLNGYVVEAVQRRMEGETE